MVRTRSLDSVSTTSGNTTSACPLKLVRKRRLLLASTRKSSCANTARPNSSSVSIGDSVAIDGMRAIRRAHSRITTRSKVQISTTSGRRTLTATMRPSGRRALCTCATAADAIGTGANSAKMLPSGRPRSDSTERTTSSNGNGPTWSCSSASAVDTYSGIRSGRVLMIWPTLMKVAPSWRKRSTTTRPSHACRRALPERRSHSASQPTQKRVPCLANRTPMTRARVTSRQRGRDFTDIVGNSIAKPDRCAPHRAAGLCCRCPMTAPAQTSPAVPAPARPAADLRKDDPPTAVELWKRRLAASPDAVAFRYYDKDVWQGMTFREADAIAREIATGLVARGVVPGDRICIVSQTRLEWVLCDIAILLAGGIAVPIYASNTAEQCEFIVRDAGAKIVMVEDATQRDKLVGLRNKLFTGAPLIQMNGEPPVGLTPPPAGADAPPTSRFVQSWVELRAAGRQWGVAHPGELDAHAETVTPESMFTIIYTSGTTGVPAGVALTPDTLVAGVCSAIRAMQIETIDVQYLFLPLAHVLGRELEWATIQMGCETAFSRGTAQIKEDLVAIRPTFMAGVPRI